MSTIEESKTLSSKRTRFSKDNEHVQPTKEKPAPDQASGSRYLTLWTLLFVLISSKFLYYVIEHLLDELVPPRSGFRLAFLATVTLLATFLYFSCTEHRIKRIESLQREKEMLRLLLCGEESCE